MRVLQINKFFWVKGGSERYFFDLSRALVDAGHEVVSFAMTHPRNEPSPFAPYFVPEVDFHGGGSPLSRVRDAVRFVHSDEAKQRIRRLIDDTKPDVAHLHNIAHQLTPSILEAIGDAGVPVVQTLHDYKLICSSYLLFANGEVCERCRTGRHHEAVRTRCHHGSLAKSVLGFVEMAWHARRHSYDRVGRFLCPSAFMRDKCAEFGIAIERLVHFPYFLHTDRYSPEPRPGEYALYVGRLSREKGVSTLLEAMRALSAARPGARLDIVGEGPLADEIGTEVRTLDGRVRVHGYQSGEALHERIRRAAFVIVPSEWYENLPYSILEAFALGKPVLGANVGGIPELVRDGDTGALFESGDAEGLAAVWERMASDPAALERMGRAARARIDDEFAAPGHVSALTDLYRSLAA